MRVNEWFITSLPLLCATISSMPFVPQDGALQHHRRRAIDYPTDKQNRPRAGKKAKRANYSVVQVDGSSPSTALAPPPTVVQTVTQTAPTRPAQTRTIILTSSVTGPSSEQTVVVTTTQEFPQATDTLGSVTAVSDVAAALSPATQTVINAVTQTVTSTPTQASTSYYDNGLWHTYYAIKTSASDWNTESTTTSSTFLAPSPSTAAQEANVTSDADTSSLSANNAGNSFALNRRSLSIRQKGPAQEFPAGAALPSAHRWAPRYAGEDVQNANRPSAAGELSPAYPSVRSRKPSKKSARSDSGSKFASVYAEVHQNQARRAPLDLKIASWNMTELLGQ